MKFGLWNRLALVLGVAGALAFPTWWALSTNAHHATVMRSGYEACIAAGVESTEPNSWNLCYQMWVEPEDGYIGWEAWGWAVLWAIPAMVAVYLILWLAVAIARWIWRGRRVPS